MFASIASDHAEKMAFFRLLDEYFTRNTTTRAATAPIAPTPIPRPSSRTIQLPSIPSPTPSPPPALPDTTAQLPSAPFLSNNATHNAISASVLRNSTVTSAALRQAGLSPAAAKSAAAFGSAHSAQLAPLATTAATSAYANRATIGNAAVAGAKYQKGDKPSGLTASSGFKSTIMSSKGWNNKEEARKQAAIPLDLAVKSAPRVYGEPAVSHVPPPMRQPIRKEEDGIGNAIAEYDYAATEADDLPLQEGEAVIILEHVSSDWYRCRSSRTGREGLVPSNYLRST